MIRGNKDAGATALRQLLERGPVAGAEDEQLLARFAERRDEVAFGVLVARHGSMVWATARAVVRHEQDAEDVFQATFLTLARRAGSVRSGSTLGPWLHRVAYREAVVASKAARRRRLREVDAGLRLAASRARSTVAVDPDLAATVRAEVERLPEVNRLPLILCDLEGLTYLEAAERLSWTEPALRNRLAQARSRLKDRLARRGFAPTAGLLAAGPAVPARLLRATTALAIGHGTPSTTVLMILHVLWRGMLMTPIWKSINAGLLLAATLGAVGYATVPTDPPRPTKPPALAPRPLAPAAPQADPIPDDPANVRGRVIDPAGQPVAGALVRTIANFDHPGPATTVVTSPDGQFVLPSATKFRHAEPMSVFRGVMATAPGFGPSWTVDTHRPDVVIRLVPPGPTVEGRLVDDRKQPVVGAEVKTQGLSIPVHQTNQTESGSLAGYFARPESDSLGAGTVWVPFERVTKTDAEGRFQINEVGLERVVSLRVSAPAVVTTSIQASTRAGEAITVNRVGMLGTVAIRYQPVKFEQTLAPTRPLTGVVTDAATGKPLADWKVQGADSESVNQIEDVSAQTDAEGRYRLTGLAVARSYRIYFTPPAGQPYLPAGFKPIEAPAGAGPVPFDLAARRAVVVRGRVTDRRTGAPLAGSLNTEALLTNSHIADYPGYAASRLVYRYTDADGRFEVEVPPGPSIIGFRARAEGQYRSGQGADQIAGYDPERHGFATVGREPFFPENYHRVARVDPPVGTDALTLDLQVDPDQTIDLAVVDPEGRPLGGLEVEGLNGFFDSTFQFQESPTVTLSGFPPDGSREVIVRHPGRKLVGSMVVRAADKGPRTLQLGPWGEIKGRIVTDKGEPRPELGLTSGPLHPTQPRPEPIGNLPRGDIVFGIKSDAQARFHVVGLIPGHHYGASTTDQYGGGIGDLFDDVTVAPGEVKDLGDLKVRRHNRGKVVGSGEKDG